MTKRKRKAPRPGKGRAPNPRGGKPTDKEITDMHDLGYLTIAEAAAAINRAGSTIYERVRRYTDGATQLLPKLREDREPVVKTASGNVWVYRESLLKGADPVAMATGKAS